MFDVQIDIQTALNNIMNWLSNNGMVLSVKKTKYLIFYTNRMKKCKQKQIENIKIKLYDSYLRKPAKYVKYVGYLLTPNLLPTYQVNNVVKKMAFDYKCAKDIWKYTKTFKSKTLHTYNNPPSSLYTVSNRELFG